MDNDTQQVGMVQPQPERTYGVQYLEVPPADVLMPAVVRVWLYRLWAVAGLVIASIGAYCAAVQTVGPAWVAGASAVLAVIGAGLGFVAAANTPR